MHSNSSLGGAEDLIARSFETLRSIEPGEIFYVSVPNDGPIVIRQYFSELDLMLGFFASTFPGAVPYNRKQWDRRSAQPPAGRHPELTQFLNATAQQLFDEGARFVTELDAGGMGIPAILGDRHLWEVAHRSFSAVYVFTISAAAAFARGAPCGYSVPSHRLTEARTAVQRELMARGIFLDPS